jgi:uncharacterized membrane protein
MVFWQAYRNPRSSSPNCSTPDQLTSVWTVSPTTKKHVVPTLSINLTGSAAIMFPLKLAILLPVLYMIDKSMQEPSLRNLTKLTLITLGLAPAIRNTLRLALEI